MYFIVMAIKSNIKKTVFVGMSGGVDSSVAAGLLKKQGYEVIGVHLRCFNLDGCADRDLEDARRAAEVLGIPFYVWDYEKEYKKDVMQYMIDGYKKGITPNPDVMCNKEIKFGVFLKRALKMGADFIATGHYVKIKRGKIQRLYIADDKNKDQSYFLWTLTQKQLKYCLFPLSDVKKPEVRKLARKFELLNANKKDSQGICFLGKVGLENFLKKYIKPKKGNIVDIEGNVLGRHEGVFYYTIGQRHGLRLDGAAKSPDSAPYYVADKILKTNTIIVAQGDNNPALYKKEVRLINVNLINKVKNDQSVWLRVRYRQPLFRAKLILKKGIRLIFSEPQKFIAIGQSAVFYSSSGEMLGGGIIKNSC
ncbi:MAG: tRNA 2-thiouridine(34) synthase MnmA [Minisyncoccota bacterium]